MEATVITKLIEASPYLAFVLLFIWFDSKREEKRTENAAALETRREAHEKEMQEKQFKHDSDTLSLWASFNQQLVSEIKLSHKAIMDKLDEHERESEERYERMGVTKDLLKAAERKR